LVFLAKIMIQELAIKCALSKSKATNTLTRSHTPLFFFSSLPFVLLSCRAEGKAKVAER
jgi:hypothetical protein